jgi:dipeptidyl aminopeptidase/acylaminoacyl peptidase
MKRLQRNAFLFGLLTLLTAHGRAQDTPARRDEPRYQRPSQAVLDVLDAAAPPMVSISPTYDYLLFTYPERYPPIADVAAPMLRLAGHRIDPRTNGPHRPGRVANLVLMNIETGKETRVKLPERPRVGAVSWSPDGKRFALPFTTDAGIELWVGETATGNVKAVPGVTLNSVLGPAIDWLPYSRELACLTVPPDRGPPPAPRTAPTGPVVQESMGRQSPMRTYQDLLQNPHDEELFDYYATSQLLIVNPESQARTPVGKPGVIPSVIPAPGGKHLLIARHQRPYSYLHPSYAFPRVVEVWDRNGQLVETLANLPLADQVPIEGVQTGPRDHHWAPTEPATVIWVEALDGGDPRTKAAHRDEVKSKKVGESPRTLAKTEHRFRGLSWTESSDLALLSDYDRERKRRRTFVIDPTKPDAAPRLLWDRSIQDRYGDPGQPASRRLPSGYSVVCVNDGSLLLDGNGAGPQGDRPFLDRLNLSTGKTDRLFRCDEKCYESVVGLLASDGSRFLTRRESPSEPPNYFVQSKDGSRKQLTHFTDPTPQLRAIKKQLVNYQRADGVALSMTLYLPPNYKEGERLPAVLWAYPMEYLDPSTAGQVTGSPYRFTTICGASHLFLLLNGYAILDGATMPVIGDPEKVNDTFVEQIVASAKAAIDKADSMGVIDPNRVGVGGHSYGAFMTANLLAHSDLFRAGVARSGAYNRTLTPFGFQSERRTFWEAPETYMNMAPFTHAHKINEPILLIHGAADNNPGTFPIQSERMYQAIKGNGGKVRFVSLPHESHGYSARESIEHTLHETTAWFDRFVKGTAAPH